MIFDASMLLGRIKEKFGSQSSFARAMGLSERSISVKINGKRDWTQSEILTACTLLELPVSTIPQYFFKRNVQKN